MKLPFRSLFVLPGVVLAAALTTAPLQAKSDAGNVTTSVGRLLEEGHYTHQALNDEVSKKFLKTYLELLDFSHLFFTQQDVGAYCRTTVGVENRCPAEKHSCHSWIP